MDPRFNCALRDYAVRVRVIQVIFINSGEISSFSLSVQLNLRSTAAAASVLIWDNPAFISSRVSAQHFAAFYCIFPVAEEIYRRKVFVSEI